MPRQLLRDGRIVEDEWHVAGGPNVVGDAQTGATSADANLIIPFDAWLDERERWTAHPGRLGVALLPAHKVERLAPDLARFALVAADFPGPTDGRGYTQARLLRERYGFTGEVRAMGYVRKDQLFFLARCGFNGFAMAQDELAGAASVLSTFTAEYQPSNDTGLAHRLQHR